MDEVVAKARRLKILVAAPETDGSSGIERTKARIEFNPIGAQFGVSELDADVAFSDRDVRPAIAVLTVSLNLEVRRCWGHLNRDLFSR